MSASEQAQGKSCVRSDPKCSKGETVVKNAPVVGPGTSRADLGHGSAAAVAEAEALTVGGRIGAVPSVPPPPPLWPAQPAIAAVARITRSNTCIALLDIFRPP